MTVVKSSGTHRDGIIVDVRRGPMSTPIARSLIRMRVFCDINKHLPGAARALSWTTHPGFSHANSAYRRRGIAVPIARVDVLSSPSTAVRIRATPPSRFAIGGERPVLHADTIHTETPLRLEAFLDAGDISIEAEGE